MLCDFALIHRRAAKGRRRDFKDGQDDTDGRLRAAGALVRRDQGRVGRVVAHGQNVVGFELQDGANGQLVGAFVGALDGGGHGDAIDAKAKLTRHVVVEDKKHFVNAVFGNGELLRVAARGVPHNAAGQIPVEKADVLFRRNCLAQGGVKGPIHVKPLQHEVLVAQQFGQQFAVQLFVHALVVFAGHFAAHGRVQRGNFHHEHGHVVARLRPAGFVGGRYTDGIGDVVARNDAVVLFERQHGAVNELAGAGVGADGGVLLQVAIDKNAPLARVVVGGDEKQNVNAVFARKKGRAGIKVVNVFLNGVGGELRRPPARDNLRRLLDCINVRTGPANHQRLVLQQATLVVVVQVAKVFFAHGVVTRRGR